MNNQRKILIALGVLAAAYFLYSRSKKNDNGAPKVDALADATTANTEMSHRPMEIVSVS